MTPIVKATKTVHLISAHETAYLLRRNLGPFKAWETWLADVRREKPGACSGLILEPFFRSKDPHFGCSRPMYALEDIKAFIIEFRSANPSSAPGIMPTPRMVKVDAEEALDWRLRRLKSIKPSATAYGMPTISTPAKPVVLAL